MKNEVEFLRGRVAELEKKCGQLGRSLRETEDRFYKIFHASSNLMNITTLREGRMIDLNEASANLGGYKREELIGQLPTNPNLFVNPKQGDLINQKVREEGGFHNLEVKVRTKAGDIRTLLMSADPITVNEEPCLLASSVDITAREKEADAVRKSEEKYRLLVENSLQGVAIIQEGHVRFSNSAFAKITGYSIAELLALPELKVTIHPDDLKLVVERFDKRMKGEPVPENYEYRIIRKDGSVRWLEVYSSLTEYEGKPAAQSVNMDITERKQAENALRESEERFRLIEETIDEMFWIYDREKGFMTYLSPAYDRIWGLSRNRILENTRPSLDAIYPDDRERFVSIAKIMKKGRPFEFEFRITRPDGSVRYICHRGFPVTSEAGEVKRYVGIEQDVTERRHAEEALKESREYLHQIINCIGDPVFAKNRDHRFVMINDALCTLFANQPDAFLGKSGLEQLSKEQAASIWEDEENVFITGKESITEDTVKDFNGKAHILMTKKSLLTDKSGNKQIIGVLRDITEYKRLEAQFLQAQKMEAIGILAGGVAHDFNNLLNVINGYSELIMSELSKDIPIRKDLEQIRDAGQRAAALTSQLLAFGRKQIMQPEILNLNTVIAQMSSMLRRLIGEDIDFVSIAQPDLGVVSADPGQMQQVIMNLVVNARDAMPQGGNLTIETANVDLDDNYIQRHSMVKTGSYVMLAISDSGIGMDADTQSHLFEPFFTTKQKGKGTGLGLSTVYGIVKQSNGYIWVYSESGKGTTFKLYFPQTAGSIAPPTEGQKSEAGFRGFETILVVEDETSVRSLAGRILRDRGYTVLEAADGMEAMHIAQEHAGEIHLVLTDVVLPGISGTAIVTRLQAVRPLIKALYVSGYTDNAIVHHGILDSNVAFLQKPFTIESLARKVREVLSA